MRKTEIVVGSIILGIGGLLLLGAVFDFDLWGLICPAGLIALGIWLIYRTRKDPGEGNLRIKFVGDIRKDGNWQPKSEETWGFVLESRLDFTQADIPDGETVYRIGAFVNDVKATIPPDVGIAVYSVAFMTDSSIQNEKQETFFIPFTWESKNYQSSSKKILLKPICFVSEIRIEHIKLDEYN